MMQQMLKAPVPVGTQHLLAEVQVPGLHQVVLQPRWMVVELAAVGVVGAWQCLAAPQLAVLQ